MTIATDSAEPLPTPLAPRQVWGAIAITITVIVWAGFALSIRAIGASPLSTADAALCRFAIPAFLLLTFLPSRWQAIRRVAPRDVAMVLAGGGLPFFWIAAAGGAETSAAHVGALIAGTVPVSLALLYSLFAGVRPTRRRWQGMAIIALGVALLLLAQPHVAGGNIWRGAALLLGASLLWATYTIGLRRTGLDAIGCTLLLAVPSSLALLLLVVTSAVPTHLGQFGLSEALPFIAVQGLGSGIVASLAYPVAIARLGAARSAVIGSLAPALASIAAVPLLGEAMTVTVALGVAAITIGVILGNRS